jgi:nitric oxide reductase NorD protein
MADNRYAPLEKLRIADPDTFVWVKGRLVLISPPADEASVDLLAEATIWGLSLEPGMGEAVAGGLLDLMAQGADDRLQAYQGLVRQAAETGPTLGRIMATYLGPVLMRGDAFLNRFRHTVTVMLEKGTYTLNAPLEVMTALLSTGDTQSAEAFLALLDTAFSQPMTYNQSLRLVYLIPKAVSGFAPRRRQWQIAQFIKVAAADLKLVDPFLDGLEKGAGLLDGTALDDFVGQALERYDHAPEAGKKFLSLASKVGKDACAVLQRAVPLAHVASQLNRYLNARIGRAIAVKPISGLPKGVSPDVSWVCSDGRFIYLPDEIDLHSDRDSNGALYRTLTRLEAGFFECRTFAFDLDRAVDLYPEIASRAGGCLEEIDREFMCDGECFLHRFTHSRLAADLFDIFEQARVTRFLWHHYPGLMRQVAPVVRRQWAALGPQASDHLLAPVYLELVLAVGTSAPRERLGGELLRLVDMFHANMETGCRVESMARLVCIGYDLIEETLGRKISGYASLPLPFNRRVRWDLVGRASTDQDRTARKIQVRLKEKGLRVYRSDLRSRLAEQRGLLSADDIADLVIVRGRNDVAAELAADFSVSDWEDILGKSMDPGGRTHEALLEAFAYPEWDHHLQDYLHDHTRVYEKKVLEDSEDDFYEQVLMRYRGLLANMRRAFELLKPEGLTLLRQWPEGDAFDYRALLDFAIDRRAGHIPSDRLFIKRLKQERDVAVLLLVDLSRSTANRVSTGDTSVLDVAKEATVLFCEALEVVGDDFAIAGFSGTGRHSVDFYGIKRFGEAMNRTVQSRISALQPQRSTRMGAAIRHAGAMLAKADARVRLMIIVSDGFPNDLGYKSDYAIADTRRSVQEARSRNLHVKAITVNVGSDPRLDDLYGRAHHHVIGDVRELPDKLLRLYGTLTRC